MSEKYIDLYERITEHARTTNDFRHGAIAVLEFLDRNPDQVPSRRTITESVWIEACKATMGGYMVAPFALAARLGITVVPDPEPTNAEKLADYVRQIGRTAMSAEECGEWLDAQGVKAPAGDDD